VPGSSRYFLGGAVVYADRLKTIFADVPEELVRTEGPVSEPVARAMAEGIRRRTGASVGVGITGIAGPGPGAPGPDAGKPIGLVYIAISYAGLSGGTSVTELNISGDRERVRWFASQHALQLVRQSLMERT
jgi:nicotinamide-nucleotide amidase